MKKIAIALLTAMMILLTSCSKISNYKEKFVTYFDKADAEGTANDIALQAISYLNDEDTEGLKSLLSEYTLKHDSNIDDDIQAAYELLDGEIISHDEHISGTKSESWEEGQPQVQYLVRFVENARTATGSNYEITFGIYLTNANEPDKEGIQNIIICKAYENREYTTYDNEDLNHNTAVYIGENWG
ncbi:MAG: DUF5104 domain-containing protein [Ruminococcus sp.]|nr:DUF5104 domain-containing protein [Ruminococcus sp.]